MKRIHWIQSAVVIVVASLGFASMGCFSMMMEMDGQKATTGERVTAAGLDVITAPVQIVMVVVVFGGLWVMQIPTMVMGGSGDETASPVNVEQNQQQEEPVAVE